MNLENKIILAAQKAIENLYGAKLEANKIPLQQTRKDQKGDYTIVVFGFSGLSKKKPEETALELYKQDKKNAKDGKETQLCKEYLTEYTNSMARSTIERWWELGNDLWVKMRWKF